MGESSKPKTQSDAAHNTEEGVGSGKETEKEGNSQSGNLESKGQRGLYRKVIDKNSPDWEQVHCTLPLVRA